MESTYKTHDHGCYVIVKVVGKEKFNKMLRYEMEYGGYVRLILIHVVMKDDDNEE